MAKAFRTLVDDGTEVSVETGLRAAEKLQSVLDGRERGTDVLELKVQLGKIGEAVVLLSRNRCGRRSSVRWMRRGIQNRSLTRPTRASGIMSNGVSGAPRKRCSPAVRHPHGAGPGRRAARDPGPARAPAGTVALKGELAVCETVGGVQHHLRGVVCSGLFAGGGDRFPLGTEEVCSRPPCWCISQRCAASPSCGSTS